MPARGGQRGGDGDHQRDRQAERVRARDHEHGDGPGDGVADLPQQRPHDERHRSRGGRHVEERGGGAVGERLGARARALCLGDEALDAGQRGVLAHPVDADAQRRVGRHRAGDHAIALTARDRPRLAGDHRLVHVRRPVDDLAVGRNPGARPDQDDIARSQRRDRHRLDRPVPDALGLVGQQLGERLQRPARLADRPHLQPVPEQHDHDQRGELPPELEVEQPQHRRRAGHERDA